MTRNPWRKVRDVSDELLVTPRAVYQWIADGKLEAVRVCGRIRISEEAVEKLMRPARERKSR